MKPVPSPAPTKRRYTKLAPSTWSEIDGLWTSGSVTLADLSDRYGITSRAAQARFAKLGLVKGSSASALAIRVKERVLATALPDEDDLARRAQAIRETAYANAVHIEEMLVACLNTAVKDPSATFAAAAQVKMLSNAAQALERLHTLKRVALGIDDNSHLDNDLPVLELQDLSDTEIADMARTNGDEPDDSIVLQEDNDVDQIGF